MSAQRREDVVVEWDNGVGAPDEEGSDGEIEPHGYAEDALLVDRGLSVGVDYVDGRAVEGLKKGCEGGMGGGERRRNRLFGRLRRRFLRRFLLCFGWHLGALGKMLCQLLYDVDANVCCLRQGLGGRRPALEDATCMPCEQLCSTWNLAS